MADELFPAYADGLVAPVPGLSQTERVVDTFVAPSKTFADILRSTSWWLPFVLMVLFTTGTNYVIGKQVGWTQVSENQMHAVPKVEERINTLPPEQKDKAMADSARRAPYTAYASPLGLLLFFAIYALVIWGTFNFGLGASTTYGQVFAVTFYSALPYLLINVLTMITLFVGNSAETFNLQNPVGTNLAYYLPDASPAIKVLLSWVDVVKIWSDVLMALGMSLVAKKSFASSALIVFGYFVLGMLVTVGLAAAFS